MRVKALVATALLVTSSLGSAVAAAPAVAAPKQAATQRNTEANAYVGTAVTFDTNNNAVVDYTVNGNTLLQNVTVQSQSNARSQGGIGLGAELESVTSLTAAALSLQATTSTHATLTTETGARIEANDNDRGILVVRASEQSQYVTANLSADARAEQVSDNRVVVTRDDGTRGAFIVVGEGNVTVNEGGNVTTALGEDATLVYRQYDQRRSDSEKQQERLIANGTAVAEVYVQQANESGQQRDRVVTNVVNYSQDTTVEVTQTSKTTVNMTVERATEKGKVVITTVSKDAFNSTEDIQVLVDGEAAAHADSYSEVAAATDGGQTSKFLVRPSTSATASVDVVIGINHFSQRNVAVTSTDGTTATPTATPTEDGGTPTDEGGTDGDGTPTATGENTETTGTVPGFSVATAIAALVTLSTGLYVRHRR